MSFHDQSIIMSTTQPTHVTWDETLFNFSMALQPIAHLLLTIFATASLGIFVHLIVLREAESRAWRLAVEGNCSLVPCDGFEGEPIAKHCMNVTRE